MYCGCDVWCELKVNAVPDNVVYACTYNRCCETDLPIMGSRRANWADNT